MAASLNGIVINEILPDPNGSTFNYDTDEDGSFDATDEFVEIYNNGPDTVDISGWTLGDDDSNTFTFPSGTEIASGNKVVLVTEYTGTLPVGFFELDRGTAVFANGGDTVVLSDGGGNQITAGYGSASGDDNFGDDTDGQSLQRLPDGSDTIVSATPTPGADNECFLTGTRILTEAGYKAVEELQIGEKVQTADGKLADIKWIGYQTIEPNSIANPLRGYPILIKAGALGNNLPCRDLCVSPDHALLVEGLLINAGALVNDTSIIKTEPTEAFVYHSIELEHHALLIAEGTSAESYMPHKEDRNNYDNAEEYEQLYPYGSNSNLMLWPMDYPRISSKVKVPSYINQKLMQIAELSTKKLASVA